jgi:molybdenum cofactor cytidylyltransferase
VSAPKIAIIVMAAGASRRLGRPKQLLELGGEPLIRHTVRNAMAANAAEVIVVLGNEADAIGAAIGDRGQRIVINERFAEGQSTSMTAGLEAISGDVDAVVMMLGDQPTVSPQLVNDLIDRFAMTRARIVQPYYDDGKPGNPVLIRRDLFPDLLAVTDDVGARGVVRAHRDEVKRVDVPLPHPLDVDTEEDYAALVAAWEQS